MTNKFNNQQEIVEYLNSQAESGDHRVLITAIRTVVRDKGIDPVAREARMTIEEVGSTLSGKTEPSFSAILKITKALGLKLHFTSA